MNNWVVFFLLLLFQFMTGLGILRLFQIWIRPGLFLPLAVLTGLAVFSTLPFLLQLLYIPLTALNLFYAIVIVLILFNIKPLPAWARIGNSIRGKKIRFYIYELPFLLVVIFILFLSAWRSYYLPPTPRDLTSGPELIAEYTVREHTMINSAFTVNLETTNNQFKPPYLTSLQVLYKFAGFPFGQVWLIIVTVFFLVFLFQAIRDLMHPIIAWMLLICFLAIPEMYAYTFMALFDYSNAVYFCLAVFFLMEYFKKEKRNYLAFAGLLMGFATYIRSETLVLAVLLAPGLLWHHVKKWDGLTTMVIRTSLFLLPAVLFYFLSVTLYIHNYLPVDYDVKGLINAHPWDLRPFFNRFIDMNYELIFSATGVNHYGYYIFIFLFVLIFDAVYTDRWTRESKNMLYALLVIYLGMPLLGHLFPLMDLNNSTKRGLFKLFPLMFLYMGHSGLFTDLSARLYKWETGGRVTAAEYS